MFGTLISSAPATERSLKQTVVSVVIHVALILAAVHVTQGAAEIVRQQLSDTTAVFLRPPDPVRTTPEPVHVAPQVTNQPPIGFLTVVPPTAMPSGIPPVDLGQSFDPSRFTGVGAEGGRPAWGGTPGTGGDSVTIAQHFTQDQVDEQVRYLGGGDPVFPPALRHAGISGRVVVEFVVSAEGVVERRSVRIVSSTSPAFERAAEEAILRARFTPAKMRGRAVRQLVQQRVVFEVG